MLNHDPTPKRFLGPDGHAAVRSTPGFVLAAAMIRLGHTARRWRWEEGDLPDGDPGNFEPRRPRRAYRRTATSTLTNVKSPHPS